MIGHENLKQRDYIAMHEAASEDSVSAHFEL